jgi:hypothetical protein
MSNERRKPQTPELEELDLDLDKETLADLEPEAPEAAQVKGASCFNCAANARGASIG